MLMHDLRHLQLFEDYPQMQYYLLSKIKEMNIEGFYFSSVESKCLNIIGGKYPKSIKLMNQLFLLFNSRFVIIVRGFIIIR